MITEVQLFFAIVGFYLFDSILLLQGHQAVISKGALDTWRVQFGANDFTLFGKEPILLNPFMPWRPAFIVNWGESNIEAIDAEAWKRRAGMFRSLFLPVTLAWLSVLVLFPGVLIFASANVNVIVVLVLMYASLLTIVFVVYKMRGDLGIPARKVAAICIECLVCPPFAINVVRKLSLSISMNQDVVLLARALTEKAGDWEKAKSTLLSRIDSELGRCDPAGPRTDSLCRRKAQIVSL